MRSLADSIVAFTKEKGSEYYDSAEWNTRRFKVQWVKKTPYSKNRRKLEELAREMNDAARGGTVGAGHTSSASDDADRRQHDREDRERNRDSSNRRD
jgi:hypothetical protein